MEYNVIPDLEIEDFDPFNEDPFEDPFGENDNGPSNNVSREYREYKAQQKALKTRQKVHVDTAYTQCCWCIPRLPDASQFKKWLPKHRHLIFGHFIYGLFLVFTTASTGTSLYRRCTANEAIFIIIILLVTSICTGVPKMIANGMKGVGPAIVSFLVMFATGISLHQKPLVCGFSGSKRGKAKQTQANMWGLVVSLQVLCILFTILLYLAWHLKHKDEKYRAEHADDDDASSDEDSMQGSPASIRWRTTDDPDEMNTQNV